MKKKTVKVETSKVTMDNGIRLIVREDHSMPTISVAVYFTGGRRIETPDNQGVTCLSQRLLTKGASQFDSAALADEMEYNGISIYPVWGMDTAGLKMQSLSRKFDEGLELFAKILMEPRFDQEEIDKEKSNQLEEIRKQRDNTLRFSMDMCRREVFEGHPYGLYRKGTEETVKSLTRDRILKYHHSLLCPQRVVVAISGDIKADQAREKIERHFSSMKDCVEIPDPGFIRGPIKNVKERVESSEKQQVAITIGFHAPDILNDDYYAFKVLNQVLSGMGARLFVELRDKMGLAYAVSSTFSSYLSGGIFRAYILTGYSQKEKARLALLEEVDRLRTRLVTYDELVRAKRYHLGLFEINLQGNTAVASRLANDEIIGLGYDFMDEYAERVKRVTRQKVKRAAEKYLKPQSYAIALLTPATFPKSFQ